MIAAIISGGENRRMPVIKGFIEINGKKIIESQLELLRGLFDRVVISSNAPELYFGLGVPVIGDVLSQRGPLTGILSVLLSTGEEEVFCVACDMPFISPELIGHITREKGGDAAVPVFCGRPEPLLSVYSKGIIETGLRRLAEGKASLTGILDEIDVRYIKEDDVRAIDPDGRSFVNINTPEDLNLINRKN